jgi:hypothetical protein
MYEKSLNEAESVLRNQREPLITVRKVWEEVVERSKVAGFEVAALADFSAMLEGDRRFQIIPARVETEESGEGQPSGEELENVEMEQLGFFPEDRVKLRTLQVVGAGRSDEDEEVGSIRRRAFIDQVGKKKKIVIGKKKIAIAKMTKMKSSSKSTKKSSVKYSKLKKRHSPVKQIKTRARPKHKK